MNQNSGVIWEVLIGVVTVLLSVCTSMFVAGTRWGRVESEVRLMSDRLAKIEGMFTLRLKDDGHAPDTTVYRDRQQ